MNMASLGHNELKVLLWIEVQPDYDEMQQWTTTIDTILDFFIEILLVQDEKYRLQRTTNFNTMI